jgi:hypothetical protein
MNTRPALPAIVFAMIVAGASPLAAHHSFGAEYDLTKPTHIQGTVVNVKWAYPHMQFTLRGRDRAGGTIDLRVEGSSPTILNLMGWTRETLMPGMNIRVGGYPAKNSQSSDFGSTTVTIISTQQVLKTPACWTAWSSADPRVVPPNSTITLAEVEDMNAHCPVPEVP